MRSWKRILVPLLLALPLLLLVGCKDDKWGEDIGAPPADVNAMRQKAKQKREQAKPAPAPAAPSQP